MSSDLHALQQRICRLEAHLQSLPPSPNCVHKCAQSAQKMLRQHVPDEITAAYEVVKMLSNIAPSNAQKGVCLADMQGALRELDALKECLGRPLASGDERDLVMLQEGVERVAGGVRREEGLVDGLLVGLDRGCVRINSRLTKLCSEIASLPAASEAAHLER